MVEDRITDSRRIAQFLASELSGLERGPLAGAEVVGANPAAEPTPGGTVAYRIEFDDVHGRVVLFPDRLEVRLDGVEWRPADSVSEASIDGDTVTVESAAAVKQVVDSLEVTLQER